jgi:hypothetical protein
MERTTLKERPSRKSFRDGERFFFTASLFI